MDKYVPGFRELGGASLLLLSATFLATASADYSPAQGPPPDVSAQDDSSQLVPVEVKTKPGISLAIGDRVKVNVFERIEMDEDKWSAEHGSTKQSPRLQQRAELSGEYLVQEDGTLSLALLGAFPVLAQSVEDVQARIAKAYQETVQRPGIVTVQILERQPIYVLGAVKNPGVYKLAPNLTVLHAVALAGGFERTNVDTWHRLEATRETENAQRSTDRLSRLLARQVVLIAERDGVAPVIPQKLEALVGRAGAEELLASEQSLRAQTITTRKSRTDALVETIRGYKEEIEVVTQRKSILDGNIKEQSERVSGLRDMNNRGLLRRPVMIQAAIDLSQAEERGQEVNTSMIQTRQKLNLAEQELATHNADSSAEIRSQLATTERELAEATSLLASSEGVLQVLRNDVAAAAGQRKEQSVEFEIIRRSAGGTDVMPATGTTDLQAGDLIQVHFAAPPANIR